MSKSPIVHSHDLQRLRNEGYDIRVESGHLIVSQVPYVNAAREVRRGTLVTDLTLAGDVTTKPRDHVIHFAGEPPCDHNGAPLSKIVRGNDRNEFVPGLQTQRSFSSKPTDGNGYPNYYEKVASYANILTTHAQVIDPSVTAKVFPVVPAEQEDSVFMYEDTASSRAQITAITRKLQLSKIAIIGLGGTGSYVLDLVAKTPVRQIHLFDGDEFLQHNAFRSPGAPSIDELKSQPMKVHYWAKKYSNMRRDITPHPHYIDETNVGELDGFAFVFLCLDKGKPKRLIVKMLEQFGIPFVDVGMGIDTVEGSLGGILRITTSTPTAREHVHKNNLIPFTDGTEDDDYSRNIQIADLNALNATLAVIKWKKIFGFYHDFRREHYSTYTIDCDMLTNECIFPN